MPDLHTIGWNADLDAAFAGHAAAGLVPGRVALEHNHVYRVLTDRGESLAEAAGRIRHQATARHEMPAVGDWVGMRPIQGSRGVIQVVLPRRSRFSRKVAGRETEEQVVAANIDTVFIVAGFDKLSGRSLERYLVLARQNAVQPVIVLNKSDVVDDLSAAVADVALLTGTTPVHAVCARDGGGFEALERYLAVGRTIALLGPSGAGKSSIINRFIGRDVLATAAVRARDARGRHTSVHRQLLVLDRGGVVIDTPGMRELQLWESAVEVDASFDDIALLGETCRFRDCRHDREPGCGVKTAVADGRLAAARYASYLKLALEREALDRKLTERAQASEGKRRGRFPQ